MLIGFPDPLLNPLIGRDDDIALVARLFRETPVRLCTITGPGGVGKTRLALHAVRQLDGSFPDGIAFIDLAPLRSVNQVIPAIARVIGVADTGHYALNEAVLAHLRSQQALLVLDNFEQILEAASLISDLLAHCPDVKVLVTSRSLLHLSIEHELPVSPLPLPESVQLFVNCARKGRPEFALTPENAALVAQICQRLDGLPLAIELAAARVRTLSIDALLGQLQQTLPILTGGPRDQPGRLQTMRNAIKWSYDLLDADEQRLFRRLSIYVDGFDLEGAEEVAGATSRNLDESWGLFDIDARIATYGNDPVMIGVPVVPVPITVLNGVSSLVEKNLLAHTGSPSSMATRYRMLDTIREFGREQLVAHGEETGARLAFVYWARGLAETHSELIWLPGAKEVFAKLDAEHENMLAALALAESCGWYEAELRLARGMINYWAIRNLYTEALFWGQRAIRLASRVPAPTRSRMLVSIGWMATMQGDVLLAEQTLNTALQEATVVSDMSSVAATRLTLGLLELHRGNPGRAMEQLEAAVPLFEELEILAVAGAHYLGSAYARLGQIALALGNRDLAARHLEEALDRIRTLGLNLFLSATLRSLGDLRREQGDLAIAAELFRESLSVAADLNDRFFVAEALSGVASVLALQDEPTRETEFLGAAASIREVIGVPDEGRSHAEYERRIDFLRGIMGADSFNLAWSQGAAWTQNEAVSAAHESTNKKETKDSPFLPQVGDSPEMLESFTRREREVLQLLAQGLSDREIAESLSISIRTVGGHVSNVLGKLGVDSRTAAALIGARLSFE